MRSQSRLVRKKKEKTEKKTAKKAPTIRKNWLSNCLAGQRADKSKKGSARKRSLFLLQNVVMFLLTAGLSLDR